MRTRDFDYDLPPERIAQHPLPERDASRMMVVCRAEGRWEHHQFRDLPAFLRADDLLVLNDTKVRPARLFGRRTDTGGNVELLLLERVVGGRWTREETRAEAQRSQRENGEVWEAIMRSGFVPRPGIELELADGRLRGEIREAIDGGRVKVALTGDSAVDMILESVGSAPLPPYIRREKGGEQSEDDRRRYQTIYARHAGAVAAPTAGLHFTESMFTALKARGVQETRITLHVGPGTFKPVRTDNAEDHRMESERFTVPAETAAAIRDARERGGRVVAVGSTSVRALESAAKGGEDRTELFIRPPYTFRAVDVMLTNFHLPCSTLLMMVAAFAAPGEPESGRALILEAYADAVRERYRFYSYGDCMLLL